MSCPSLNLTLTGTTIRDVLVEGDESLFLSPRKRNKELWREEGRIAVIAYVGNATAGGAIVHRPLGAI